MRDAEWRHGTGAGRSASCRDDFEGWRRESDELGVNAFVLGPGEPMAMYHWEADQEDFLVVSGEAVLIVEGEERPLSPWDLVHCPPRTKHVLVGAGTAPCLVIAVALARTTAARVARLPGGRRRAPPRCDVAQDTTDGGAAYASVPRREPTSTATAGCPSRRRTTHARRNVDPGGGRPSKVRTRSIPTTRGEAMKYLLLVCWDARRWMRRTSPPRPGPASPAEERLPVAGRPPGPGSLDHW